MRVRITLAGQLYSSSPESHMVRQFVGRVDERLESDSIYCSPLHHSDWHCFWIQMSGPALVQGSMPKHGFFSPLRFGPRERLCRRESDKAHTTGGTQDTVWSEEPAYSHFFPLFMCWEVAWIQSGKGERANCS